MLPSTTCLTLGVQEFPGCPGVRSRCFHCHGTGSISDQRTNIPQAAWLKNSNKRAGAWCTGKTQWDRVEREGGGGIGMGNTCKSMADSCQCKTKPTTIS